MRRGRQGRSRRRLRRRAFALVLLACAVVAGLVAYRGTPAPGSWVFERDPAQADVPLAWDEGRAPDYYEVVGAARFDTELAAGTAVYAPLDLLGRAGRVDACVDAAMAQAGSERERGNLQAIEPSGWGHNAEADIELPTGDTYHGWFWNRSHLLAKSLGGSDEAENLVCGTRMQNVGANRRGSEGGMAYCENLVRDWLDQNPGGSVRYSAEPLYVGREAVCRCVLVDVLSSDGALDLEVVVYNAAKGYDIDYRDGTFSLHAEGA